MSVRYPVVYEKGPVSWGASVPDLPGCIAVGATLDEVERLVREAIEAHIEALRESGIPIPEPAHQVGEVRSDEGLKLPVLAEGRDVYNQRP